MLATNRCNLPEECRALGQKKRSRNFEMDLSMARENWNRLKRAYIYWLARRLPSCEELLPFMSQQMDTKLHWCRRLTLLLHNHICEWCRRYADQLLVLRETMRNRETRPENISGTDGFLTAEAKDRIKRSLRQ